MITSRNRIQFCTILILHNNTTTPPLRVNHLNLPLYFHRTPLHPFTHTHTRTLCATIHMEINNERTERRKNTLRKSQIKKKTHVAYHRNGKESKKILTLTELVRIKIISHVYTFNVCKTLSYFFMSFILSFIPFSFIIPC